MGPLRSCFLSSHIYVIPAAVASMTQSTGVIELVGVSALSSILLSTIERVALLTHALRVVLLFGVWAQLNFPTPSAGLNLFLLICLIFNLFGLHLGRLFFYRFERSLINFPFYDIAINFKIEDRSPIRVKASLILFIYSWPTLCSLKKLETPEHLIIPLKIGIIFFLFIHI